MTGLVTTLLIGFLGAAVAGTVITGLFWLTLVGVAGILVVGGVGVDLLGRRMTTVRPLPERAGLRLVESSRGNAVGRGTRGRDELGQAA